MSSYGERSPPFDEDEMDFASAYSLASTSNEYMIEHGRHFFSRDSSSPFPRGDQVAKENEIALHNLMFHLYDNRLYEAPIQQPRNVLEVRCGTQGLWAKSMADVFPDAQVTGMDVATPDTEGRENLQFVEQSHNDQWILDDKLQQFGKFDFLYARHLFASSRDYPDFYKQCLEHLEPGGYFEQCEMIPFCRCDDDTFREGSIVRGLCDLIPAMERGYQTQYDLASRMEQLIQEAGFVDIQRRIDKVPWSPWPPPETKEHRSGELFERFYQTGIQGWTIQPLVRHLQFDQETVNNMVSAAIIELNKNEIHWWSPSVTVTARKPLESPS